MALLPKTLSGKIVALTLAPLGVIFLVAWLVLMPVIRKGLLESRREYLQHLTETACGILEGQEAQAKAGAITQAEAQRRALDLIKGVRFGKTGYFYVFTRDLKIVTVPIKPEMEGKAVDTFQDAKGKLIYVELNKLGREPQGGFLDLMFAKPGQQGAFPKMNYVKAFEPWGWNIGTGVYMDDLDAEVRAYTLAILGTLLVLSFLLFLGVRTFVRRVTRPLRELVRGSPEQRSLPGPLPSRARMRSARRPRPSMPITPISGARSWRFRALRTASPREAQSCRPLRGRWGGPWMRSPGSVSS